MYHNHETIYIDISQLANGYISNDVFV